MVDDHEFFRAGLRVLLAPHPDVEVVGEAEDGVGVVELYGRRRPDVVLMDLKMPRVSGDEATEQLTRRWPDARVVMLTASAEDSDVVEAIRVGALGYLVKDASTDEITQGIRAAASGHFLVSPRVAGAVVGAAETAASRARAIEQIKARLTARYLAASAKGKPHDAAPGQVSGA